MSKILTPYWANFSFDDVGDAVYDPIVLIVKDGKFEVFGDDAHG